MADRLTIENQRDLRAWLETRDQADAIAIASRAALRALPALVTIFDTEQENPRKSIILPIFRATHASAVTRWGIVTAEAKAAALSAADSALSAADSARSAADSAALSALSAARSAADSADSAALSAHSAAHAAHSAADSAADSAALSAAHSALSAAHSAAWALIERDAMWRSEAGDRAAFLARPLWPDDPPDRAEANWKRLKAILSDAEDEDWGFWIDWYEGQLAGTGNASVNLPLEEAILLIPDATWEAGPKEVHEEIRRLQKIHAPKRRLRLTIKEALILAEQDGRGFSIVVENNSFVLDAKATAEREQIEADLPMIRNRAERLVRAFQSANYPLQQDCADDARMFRDMLAGDYDAVAKQARNLWNISIGFGSAFERDSEERKRGSELLTADQRAAVDVFLSTSANFVRLFPAVREMDSENTLHRNIENRHALTRALIETSMQHEILLKADADILLALAQIADAATAQSAKAANALDVTKTNLLKRVAFLGAAGAGAVAQGALTQVGVDLETQLQLSERSIEFIGAAENDIRAFIVSLPSDIRAPMSHAIDAILGRNEDG